MVLSIVSLFCLLLSFFFHSKAESTLRVVRAQLDNGERVVGMRYPEILIPLVEKAIEEERTIKHIAEKQQVREY